MLRTHLALLGKVTAHFTDPTVEDAIDRIRTMAHSLVKDAREDMRGRQITLFVGPIKGTNHESLPRKTSNSTLDIGLDNLAVLTLIDRAIRLHHHPAVKSTVLDAEQSQDTLIMTDHSGQQYEVTVRKVNNSPATGR